MITHCPLSLRIIIIITFSILISTEFILLSYIFASSLTHTKGRGGRKLKALT